MKLHCFIIAITFLLTSCATKKVTSPPYLGHKYLRIDINDKRTSPNFIVGSMSIDSTRNKGIFTLRATIEIDRDHRIETGFNINTHHKTPSLEVEKYNLDDFEPVFITMRYDSVKTVFKGVRYKNISGSLNVTKFDSINPHLYLVEGNFDFITYRKKTNETVHAIGSFENFDYYCFYSELNE